MTHLVIAVRHRPNRKVDIEVNIEPAPSTANDKVVMQLPNWMVFLLRLFWGLD